MLQFVIFNEKFIALTFCVCLEKNLPYLTLISCLLQCGNFHKQEL